MQPKPDPDVLAEKMRRRLERAFPVDSQQAKPRNVWNVKEVEAPSWLLIGCLVALLVVLYGFA